MESTRRYGPYTQIELLTIDTLQKAHSDGTTFESGNDNPVLLEYYPEVWRVILYYKADTSKSKLEEIYCYEDNAAITTDKTADGQPLHPDFDTPEEFYEYIWDPQTGISSGGAAADAAYTNPNAQPFNKDSFILIMAGPDCQYGTDDDITNYLR